MRDDDRPPEREPILRSPYRTADAPSERELAPSRDRPTDAEFVAWLVLLFLMYRMLH